MFELLMLFVFVVILLIELRSPTADDIFFEMVKQSDKPDEE